MTEPAAPAPRKPQPKRPGPLTTFAITAAAFLVVLTLLAWQVRAGKDPAIGPAKPAAAPVAKKVIVVRRIERKVIIEAPAPTAAAASGGAPARAASAPAASAPAAAAPAPAAPAPAPAPVLATRSS
jgi:hypothetical protein